MEPASDRIESLLRELRPEPPAEFVRELEASLLPRSHRRQRLQVLVAAGALCACFVALTLALSVAGLLPWHLGQSDSVKARGDCKTVTVVRHERRPILVTGEDGKIRTEERVVPVRTPVKHCRSARGR